MKLTTRQLRKLITETISGGSDLDSLLEELWQVLSSANQQAFDAFCDKVEDIHPDLIDGMWIQYGNDSIMGQEEEAAGGDWRDIGADSPEQYRDMAIQDFEENYREVMGEG